MAKLGKIGQTCRGFQIIEFHDTHGVACSLQQSSACLGNDENDRPGTTAIWLGCNDLNLKRLEPGKGWVNFPIPEDVQGTTRMHLDRETAENLIRAISSWLTNGTFNGK
jgi:hypothetical protein